MPTTNAEDLLAQTLAAAVRDRQTVRQDGERTDRVTDGVRFRRSPTFADARGTVVAAMRLPSGLRYAAKYPW